MALQLEHPETEVVFITGASKGIGRAVAVGFAKAGVHQLCLIARSLQDLNKTAELCTSVNPHSDILCISLDVCDTRALSRAVDDCLAKYGKITTAVHNVGAHGLQSAVSSSLSEFDKNIQVNLLSVIHASRLLLPHLVRTQENQQARTIFISSALAQKWAMVPGWTAYTASKCGITGYADAAYAELRQCGMKVTVIYPGLVSTEMGTDFSGDLGKLLNHRVPLDQFLQPEDVADAVLAVCSPLVGCVTDLSLYPQADLYRMRILTEPKKVQALADIPLPRFSDKRVALVTGAGKGIGRGIALQFAKEGYGLCVIARTQANLDSLVEECREIYKSQGNLEASIINFAIDVTDKEKLIDCVAKTVEHFGSLSTVISNAGVNRRKSAALANIAVWESVVQTNVVSAMHLTALTLPHLLRHAKNSASKSAYLVFINSNYANSRASTLPGASIYSATKSALAGFARTVLEDVRDWGVKVSTLYPSLVNTELGLRPNPQQKQGKGVGSGGGFLLPPQEMIQVEDIAKLVSYTCSVRSNCVVSDIAIDTQKNQQPIIRQLTQQFQEKHWPLADAKL